MSKFANTFLNTLNEELEKEGNAFTRGLAKTRKGGKFKVGDKEVTDTSNYDDSSVKERKMTPGEKKKAKKLHKDLPTSAFTKQYGKKGKQIKYATATKMAMKEAFDGTSIPAEAAPADTGAEISDEEAYRRSLDRGTDPKDFDVADNPQLKVDSSGVEAARGWIAKLEEMADFVNGTGPESLNSQINQLEIKNSVPFRGVVRREEKRITKLAENLRGLAEVFKSVVITSEKKVKDASTPR